MSSLFKYVSIFFVFTWANVAYGDNSTQCPCGFATYRTSQGTKKCYQAFSERVTWNDAKARCTSLGGRLPSIHSQSENDFLTEFIALSNNLVAVDAWIGLKNANGAFSWDDGSTVDYRSTWWPDHPRSGGVFCTLIVNHQDSSGTGQWWDGTCDNGAYGYVCGIDPLPSPPPVCPMFYTPWSGMCYRAIHKEANFMEAQSLCKADHGANLVSVHNAFENSYVMDLTKIEPFSNCANPNPMDTFTWIGLTDNLQEDFWSWTDGTPLDYQRWAPGQPQPSDSLNCACVPTNDLQPQYPRGYWRNCDCNQRRKVFACKIVPKS